MTRKAKHGTAPAFWLSFVSTTLLAARLCWQAFTGTPVSDGSLFTLGVAIGWLALVADVHFGGPFIGRRIKERDRGAS